MSRRTFLLRALPLFCLAFLAPMARGQATEQVVYDNFSALSSWGPNYLFDEPNGSSMFAPNVGFSVSSLVADDLILKSSDTTPIIPQPLRLTRIAFYVTNRNPTAVTVRLFLRLWNDDFVRLGIPDTPGTLLFASYLGVITLPAAPAGGFSVMPVTAKLRGNQGVNLPGGPGIAGDPYRVWAGLIFDNGGTSSTATQEQLDNIGQLVNNVDKNESVLVGRSGDVAWSGTGSAQVTNRFDQHRPPGAFFNYAGSILHPGDDPVTPADDPYANFAWKVWAEPGYTP